MEMVTDLQDQYPYSTSQESDINELNQDLICIVATQCWKDQLKVAGGLELKGVQYKALMENPSLVGAANSTMTADAFRRQLSSFMSTVISKGAVSGGL
ncbi:hypothetical protein E2562_015799 [Oryza meyeriana var. granulata]|uniref:Uncharacterized protein n=1 Tax=Oryza meyeriana var. granulata TaxID=110450 RepID=A0A6G1D3K5_9ORYZ|nr:hypothetical protein E2562_015797 [Oryza meyeriana var. granulata]KAF0907298.1 hypothetical protein E2562_015799 [Oryza meyeriana var. granulata]